MITIKCEFTCNECQQTCMSTLVNGKLQRRTCPVCDAEFVSTRGAKPNDDVALAVLASVFDADTARPKIDLDRCSDLLPLIDRLLDNKRKQVDTVIELRASIINELRKSAEAGHEQAKTVYTKLLQTEFTAMGIGVGLNGVAQRRPGSRWTNGDFERNRVRAEKIASELRAFGVPLYTGGL